MATVHREPNQVKWIGVRPGHNGTEQLVQIECGGNLLVYTVPADKLFLIYDWQFSVAGGVAGAALLSLRTAVPAIYYHLAYVTSVVGSSSAGVSQALWIPIELPATYQIYVTTNQPVRGGVHGILIDA